jgi:catechol 2,3-dioxygenase-like lactoylglutathione lyase family enzyme
MKLTVHHLGIVARDVAVSTDFYLRLLDAEVLPTPQAGHVLLRAGDLHLALVPPNEGDPDGYAWGNHLALETTETPAAILGRLAALGCVHENVRGRVYTRDPDGFTLEFLFV